MTSPVTMLPPGYTRVRILKECEYARERLPVGSIAIVDEDLARRWLRAGLAEAAPEPVTKVVQTSCPKCGAAMEYAAAPAPDQRWVTCGNPACAFGWLR